MPRLFATITLATFVALTGGSALAADGPAKPFRDCPDCPEMVAIPAGGFKMGSTPEERAREGVPPAFGEREGPVVQVTFAKPFALAKTETTKGQFAQFVKETNRPDPPNCITYNQKTDSWGDARPDISWKNAGFPQTDDHPAVCISWTDANDYAAWLAKKTGKPYRLASESEWEYAVRGGTTTERYWGDAIQPVCEKADIMSSGTFEAIGRAESWKDKLVCASENAWTIPVASFDPNPFGLYDMYGSVWEWVADCATPDHSTVPSDGKPVVKAGCDSRIVKGGAFHSVPWLIRPATRGAGIAPDNHPIASGFRVARDLP
jgi:formylglycine-generating enzyme required for sulfatase activity